MKIEHLSYNHSEVDDAIKRATQAINYGPSEWTIDGIATGAEPNGEMIVKSSPVANFQEMFRYHNGITSIVIDIPPTIPGTEGSEAAFASIPNLKSVYIKSLCKQVGRRWFNNCYLLESIVFDINCNAKMHSWWCTGCRSLKFFDGGNIKSLGSATLPCPIETLILRSTDAPVSCSFSSFPTFEGSSTIDNGGTGCDIYVPASLIDAYRADTNWAAWDAYGTLSWHTIEGSEYE